MSNIKSNIKYMALLSVLLLVSQNPVGLFAADEKTNDNTVSSSSEQEKSSDATSDIENKDKNKNDKNTEEKENDSEKTVSEQDKATEKKFSYDSREYADANGRILGNYPEISDMTELSQKIYSDIETAVSELNLDNYDSNVVTFNVKDDVKPGFVEIYVKVENGDSSSEFKYYVYKANNSWTTSESEYEETIKKLEEKNSEEEKQKKDTDTDNETKQENKDSEKENNEKEKSEGDKSSESTSNTEKSGKITMVPLRANAERLGWKVEWEQKTAVEPSKAILTKGNQMIKILVDPNTNYDLVINRDTTKTFIEPAKLDKPAELQDEVLYVPSTFIDKLSKEVKDKDSKSDMKDDMKDKAKENGDRDKKDKPPIKPEDRDK